MTPTELFHLSITEAASGLRRKEFSPVELAQACLKRMESIDGKLHSFITVTADVALEQARKAEHELRAGTIRARFMAFQSRSRISMRPRTSAQPAILPCCRIGCLITTQQP